jgi:hypothetical protein
LSNLHRVTLRPSRAVTFGVATAHAGALAGAALGLPPLAAAVAGAGLLVSAFHHLRLVRHRTPAAIAAIEFGADGRFAIAGPAGDWRDARLVATAVLASWLAVLVARDATGAWRSTLVVPDAADADGFRRLRTWLRWRPPLEAASGR